MVWWPSGKLINLIQIAHTWIESWKPLFCFFLYIIGKCMRSIFCINQDYSYILRYLLYSITLQRFVCTKFLPTKSDSVIMFCLQSYQRYISIGHLTVYYSHTQERINTQVIYRFMLAQVKCTR